MRKFDSISGEKGRELARKAVEKYLAKYPEPKSPPKKVITKSSNEIYRIKSMFPFQLFPDELIIFPENLTFIINNGPGMKVVRDLYIRDIAQVQGNAGPLFGNLRIISKLQTEEPIILERARRKDVLKARKVIQGLVDKKQIPDSPQKASIY